MSDIVSGPAATVPEGSRVVLMVSRRDEDRILPEVLVPDVTGMALPRAGLRLQKVGFRVRAVNEYNDEVRRSRVVGQLPAAGSTATEASEVVLLVSSGPAEHVRPAAILPEVVGMHEQEAVTVIESAGLHPQIAYSYDAATPDGVVSAQLPDRTWLAVPRRRPAPWWIWALVAATLALLAIVAFALLGRSQKVSVPSVQGMTQAQAIAAIREVGLKPQVTAEQSPREGQVAGTVAAQDPLAGTIVTSGSIVEIRVVGTPESATVPDVVGLAREVAQERLQSAGFIAQLTEREVVGGQAGFVVEQDPSAGTSLAPGATVSIVIAADGNAGSIAVPALEGLVREDAEETLRTANLDVQIAENPSSDVAEGTVIMQYPPQGTQVKAGSTVGAIISAGPPEDATTTQLPDLVGQSIADAEARAAGLGLRSEPVSLDGSTADREQVVAQLPPGSAVVTPGSVVLLFYSSGR